MATNWRAWDQKGTFEVTQKVEGWVRTDDPGEPLGDPRTLLPGTYTVTQESQATPITSNTEPRGIGSFGGSYYTVDIGEPVIVSSRSGSFTPEQ